MRVEIYYDEPCDALRIEDNVNHGARGVISLQQSRAKIARELVAIVLRLFRIQGVK